MPDAPFHWHSDNQSKPEISKAPLDSSAVRGGPYGTERVLSSDYDCDYDYVNWYYI